MRALEKERSSREIMSRLTLEEHESTLGIGLLLSFDYTTIRYLRLSWHI